MTVDIFDGKPDHEKNNDITDELSLLRDEITIHDEKPSLSNTLDENWSPHWQKGNTLWNAKEKENIKERKKESTEEDIEETLDKFFETPKRTDVQINKSTSEQKEKDIYIWPRDSIYPWDEKIQENKQRAAWRIWVRFQQITRELPHDTITLSENTDKVAENSMTRRLKQATERLLQKGA